MLEYEIYYWNPTAGSHRCLMKEQSVHVKNKQFSEHPYLNVRLEADIEEHIQADIPRK